MNGHTEEAADQALKRLERMKWINRRIAEVACVFAVAALVVSLVFTLTSQHGEIAQICKEGNRVSAATGKYLTGLLQQSRDFVASQSARVPANEQGLLKQELALYDSEIAGAKAAFAPTDCPK